jgi:hypothetical protein
MQIRHSLKLGALALFFGASLLAALPLASYAGAGESSQRYRFDVLDQPVPVGAHTELTIKLTDASTGQAVQGATITGAGLEMTHPHPPHKGTLPGGMTTTMTGEVKFVGSSGPGSLSVDGRCLHAGELETGSLGECPWRNQACSRHRKV